MSGDAKAIETKFFSMGDIGTICFQTLSLQIFQFRNIIFSKKRKVWLDDLFFSRMITEKTFLEDNSIPFSALLLNF
jgi:hypothetical protein